MLFVFVVFTVMVLTRAREIKDRCSKEDVRLGSCSKTTVYVDGPGWCLAVVSEEKTWAEARRACMQRAGNTDILSIPDKMTDTMLNQITRSWTDKQMWIGLTDRDVEGTFKWVSDNRIATSFNWAQGQPPADHKGKDCVRLSTTDGGWTVEDCDKKLGSICIKRHEDRSSPAMAVKLDAPPDIVYGGDKLEVICLAQAGKTGQVYFKLVPSVSANRPSTLWSESDDKNAEFQAEEIYLVNDKHCGRYINASLAIRTSSELHRSDLMCCVQFEHNFTSCSDKQFIQIAYKARQPTLEVTYHRPVTSTLIVGLDLEAVCTAPVGTGQNTQLEWVLKTRKSTFVWTIDRDGHLKLISAKAFPCARISHGPETMNSTLGPEISSTLKVKVTEDMADATLSCNIKLGSAPATPALSRASQKFELRYVPSRPMMEVKYDLEPNIVYTNSVMLVNCTAQVGTDGILVWVLDSIKTHRLRGLWEVRLNGTVSGPFEESVKVVANNAKRKQAPLNITSTFTLNIGSDLQKSQGSIIACFSHDPLQRGDNVYQGKNELMQHTFPLRVRSTDITKNDHQVENAEALVVPPSDADRHWDESPAFQMTFLGVMAIVVAQIMITWNRIPSGHESRKSRVIKTPDIKRNSSIKRDKVISFQDALRRQSSCEIVSSVSRPATRRSMLSNSKKFKK